MVSKLNHSNIVKLFELIQDGPPGVVMEWIDGVTLSRVIEALGADEISLIIESVANALSYAHTCESEGGGILHRDVTPNNIMIASDGHVKLTDFGVAHLMSDDRQSHAEMGTIPYCAPEVLRREKATAKSDIYGLGAVLHELMTGQHHLESTPDDVLKREIASMNRIPVIGPTEHPRWLVDLHDWMLAPDPEDRPSAHEVVETIANNLPTYATAAPKLASRVSARRTNGVHQDDPRGPDNLSTMKLDPSQSATLYKAPEPAIKIGPVPLDPELEKWWYRFVKYNACCGIPEVLCGAVFVVLFLGIEFAEGLILLVVGVILWVVAGVVMWRTSYYAMEMTAGCIPAAMKKEHGSAPRPEEPLDKYRDAFSNVVSVRRKLVLVAGMCFLLWSTLALIFHLLEVHPYIQPSIFRGAMAALPVFVCGCLFLIRLHDFDPIPLWCHDDLGRPKRLDLPPTGLMRVLAVLSARARAIYRAKNARELRSDHLHGMLSHFAFGLCIAFFGFSVKGQDSNWGLALFGVVIALVGMIVGRGFKFWWSLQREAPESEAEIAVAQVAFAQSFGLIDHHRAVTEHSALRWRDPLTGLPRRDGPKGFDQELEDVVAKIRDTKVSDRPCFTILFFEVVNLPEVYRLRTRRVGENALISVAETIENLLRAGEGEQVFLASYDTFTFAAIIRSCTTDQCKRLMKEKIKPVLQQGISGAEIEAYYASSDDEAADDITVGTPADYGENIKSRAFARVTVQG